MTPSVKEMYDEQGYVIVPGLVTSEHFTLLSKACERVIAKTRSGAWPHRRTVGRQFPPYENDNTDSWGVQHVMHPDLGEPVFAEWYTSEGLLAVVRELLQCREDELQMELFNLLINPLNHHFALRWHRDDVKEDATADEEAQALAAWKYGVQWNTALYEDSCLFIVPKSHRIPRTAEQRAHSITQDAPKNPLDMPDAIRVTLRPGETVFYNSNVLHCATYDLKKPRCTLHACVGDVKGGSTRARNVLQHGLRWMTEDRFRSQLGEKGRAMVQRLIAMQTSVEGQALGYSLSN
ncbi:hypothetical protein F5J12DRAFT_49901 [Pisolithus orientalis]|uniref:uncharacterized protein n=1 Tax=Pisolithus orientalis TaxID=936130 RepID=UPI0022244ABD|nr:uncharacterized protein F5J12DRAFT_49901 [Pisolithus orientalis]KAI6008728.1 hypothetical protein F5J12DRAFT_49901 [Pisolithus orientalis]